MHEVNVELFAVVPDMYYKALSREEVDRGILYLFMYNTYVNRNIPAITPNPSR